MSVIGESAPNFYLRDKWAVHSEQVHSYMLYLERPANLMYNE